MTGLEGSGDPAIIIAERDRLRLFLGIARSALGTCSAILLERWHPFALESEAALRESNPEALRADAGAASSGPQRFGYRRNTHGPNGEFRLGGIHADAGFLIHMLDSRKAMSRAELASAVDRYDADFPDAAPACLNLNENLLALLECGMAVVEVKP